MDDPVVLYQDAFSRLANADIQVKQIGRMLASLIE